MLFIEFLSLTPISCAENSNILTAYCKTHRQNSFVCLSNAKIAFSETECFTSSKIIRFISKKHPGLFQKKPDASVCFQNFYFHPIQMSYTYILHILFYVYVNKLFYKKHCKFHFSPSTSGARPSNIRLTNNGDCHFVGLKNGVGRFNLLTLHP